MKNVEVRCTRSGKVVKSMDETITLDKLGKTGHLLHISNHYPPSRVMLPSVLVWTGSKKIEGGQSKKWHQSTVLLNWGILVNVCYLVCVRMIIITNSWTSWVIWHKKMLIYYPTISWLKDWFLFNEVSIFCLMNYLFSNSMSMFEFLNNFFCFISRKIVHL